MEGSNLQLALLKQDLRFKALKTQSFTVMGGDASDEIHLEGVYCDQGPRVPETPYAFHMVRVSVRDDDEVNILGRKGEIREAVQDVLEKVVMTGVHQNLFFSIYKIGVTIVCGRVGPAEGIQIVANFHETSSVIKAKVVRNRVNRDGSEDLDLIKTEKPWPSRRLPVER
jgi:hypothetical protein